MRVDPEAIRETTDLSDSPLVLIGPGGCGKTHRLDALAAAHDGPVARVTGTDLESGIEFGALRSLIDHSATQHDAAKRLRACLEPGSLLIVDDAHHLDGASIATIALLAADGPALAVAHRRSERVDLASLDHVLSNPGTIIRVGPLNRTELEVALTEATGDTVDAGRLAAVFAASGGVPAWAVHLVDAATDDLDTHAAQVLAGPVQHHLTQAGAAATTAAELITLAPALAADVMAAVAQTSGADLRRSLDQLANAGLLDPEQRCLVPAVRATVDSLMTSARRRELHSMLAAELVAHRGDVTEAASHLRQSGAIGAAAADLFTQAGDELRFHAPARAIEWYDEASIAGGLSTRGTVGRIEAESFAGLPMLGRTGPAQLTDEARSRLIAIKAVDEAREARPGRAAELFSMLATGSQTHPTLSRDTARLLSETMRSASEPAGSTGGADSLDPPTDPLDTGADMAYRLAAACRAHTCDPDASPASFVDAAEAFERSAPEFVVPDSPYAIGALHLSSAGDLTGAELLLSRAESARPTTPMLAARHRLLRAWVHLRSGRYELPVSVLGETTDRGSAGHSDARDRLIHCALAAGIARRNGDIAALRDAWTAAEPLLLAQATDLFHLEAIGELVLAAARMRRVERAEPALDALEDLAGDVDAGPWGVAHAWLLVQIAVESEDPDALGKATSRLRSVATDRPYDNALVAAADAWASIIAAADATGAAETVEQASEMLAGRSLSWEASRLAGQAAVRVKDPAVARRLLELARQHHRAADRDGAAAVSDAGLTDRETAVARLVLDGLTYREIGTRIYISPKTVEHHVASIRRKTAAGSRAEMLAILRDIVPASASTGPQ